MAAGDYLTLNNPIAPRLIRCLYIVALVLIAVMVVLGLVRGVRTMMRTPPPRPAMAQNQTPNAGAPAPDAATQAPGPQRPGMMQGRRFGPRPGMMMNRRFGRPRGPLGMGFLPRNPMIAGIWIILGTLLRGAITLMVVRILAELGLAVLAMPRRSEI